MSNVPKSERKESPAEFLRVARQLKIMTVQKCNHIPKKLWMGLAMPIIQQVTEAKSAIVTGNSIYPTNHAEAADRRRYFVIARAKLYSMASNVDDLLELREQISIGYEAIDEWTSVVYRLIKLIGGVMDSDSQRYRNLP